MTADIVMCIKAAIFVLDNEIGVSSIILGNKVPSLVKARAVTGQDPQLGKDGPTLQLKPLIVSEDNRWQRLGHLFVDGRTVRETVLWLVVYTACL